MSILKSSKLVISPGGGAKPTEVFELDDELELDPAAVVGVGRAPFDEFILR